MTDSRVLSTLLKESLHSARNSPHPLLNRCFLRLRIDNPSRLDRFRCPARSVFLTNSLFDSPACLCLSTARSGLTRTRAPI